MYFNWLNLFFLMYISGVAAATLYPIYCLEMLSIARLGYYRPNILKLGLFVIAALIFIGSFSWIGFVAIFVIANVFFKKNNKIRKHKKEFKAF